MARSMYLGGSHVPRWIAGSLVLGAVRMALAGDATEHGAPDASPPRSWNWHAQATGIVQAYPAFEAPYSGPYSLPPGGQARQTTSFDLTAGVRPWAGAELFVDGLMWQGYGLGNARGIAGFPNGEAFRLGTTEPNGAISRLFLRQTIGLGGAVETVADDALNLGGERDVSRVTVTMGRVNVKDIFDNNAYANNPRTQFMNWALMANQAWDYPADALGYTTGMAAELNQPGWALRYGLFQLPAASNGLTFEDRLFKWPPDGTGATGSPLESWGMVVEWERRHVLAGRPGAIRWLAYWNRARMGNYLMATQQAGRPATLDGTRADRNKLGAGLNVEQELADGIGIFSRVGWSDGRNEAWVFSDVDWTVTAGLSARNRWCSRPDDTLAIAGILNGISGPHAAYLRAGGTGILAGDGTLAHGQEGVLETYYDLRAWRGIRVAFDYQLVIHPAFNRDRGPVHVLGARVHWEY